MSETSIKIDLDIRVLVFLLISVLSIALGYIDNGVNGSMYYLAFTLLCILAMIPLMYIPFPIGVLIMYYLVIPSLKALLGVDGGRLWIIESILLIVLSVFSIIITVIYILIYRESRRPVWWRRI